MSDQLSVSLDMFEQRYNVFFHDEHLGYYTEANGEYYATPFNSKVTAPFNTAEAAIKHLWNIRNLSMKGREAQTSIHQQRKLF